jgi:hypothetical protein
MPGQDVEPWCQGELSVKCLSTAGVAAISSFVSGLPPKKNDRLAELYPHILLGLKPFSNEIVAGAQDSSRVRCPFHFVISLKVGKVFKTFFVCHGCICELYDLSHSSLERAIKAAKIQIAADQTGNLNGLTLPPRASANGRGRLLSLCLDRIEDKSGDLYLLLRRNSESVRHR